MIITALEFGKNLNKYLELSSKKDIIITKDDVPIAKIVGIQEKEIPNIESLFGILPSDIDEEDILKERAATL